MLVQDVSPNDLYKVINPVDTSCTLMLARETPAPELSCKQMLSFLCAPSCCENTEKGTSNMAPEKKKTAMKYLKANSKP